MSKSEQLLGEIRAKAKEIYTDAYPMSIGELMSLYRDEELDIHPEFQRFFRWSNLQKSKFIESILLGIPIPSVFVSQREDGVWDVVDGVQRLSTIFEFTGMLRDQEGQILPPSRLIGTEYLPGLENMAWQDESDTDFSFPSPLRIDFKRQKVDLKIVKKDSDPSTKYDLFERLNTLGSQLSDQEVRNCLLVMINLDMYRWFNELSSYEPFQEAIALTDRSLLRRYDMELVLRFIILTRAEVTQLQGIKDVANFITSNMKQLAIQGFNREFEGSVFKKCFSTLGEIIGPSCFVRVDMGRGRGGFKLSVFEVVAVGLGKALRQNPQLIIDPTWLKQQYTAVFSSNIFQEYSKSGKSASSRIPRLIPLGRDLFGS